MINNTLSFGTAQESKPITKFEDIKTDAYRQEAKAQNKKYKKIGFIAGAGIVGGTVAQKTGEVLIKKRPAMEVLKEFVKPIDDFVKKGHQPIKEAFSNKKYFKGSWEAVKYPVKGFVSLLNLKSYPKWAKVAMGVVIGGTALTGAYEGGKLDQKHNIKERTDEYLNNLKNK